MKRLAKIPLADIRRALREPQATDCGGGVLVRYWRKMAPWIREAAAKLVEEYDGDASTIWRGCATAGEVVERLDEFSGIGQKKAHMAARILHEDEEWQFKRWDQINVAVDVHIRRVFKRTGLTKDTSTQGIMAAATKLWPKYPGALDYPTWRIGVTWCRKRRADCSGEHAEDGRPCPLRGVCAKRGVKRRPKRRI